MHITVRWIKDKDQFNVSLHASPSAEEFLTIRGCRLREHGGREFISFPSRKNENTGKWWDHVWANDKFQAAAIKIAKESRETPRDGGASTMADDIPF